MARLGCRGRPLRKRSVVSSFVWMKVLKSAPERYDLGVRMLSRGRRNP